MIRQMISWLVLVWFPWRSQVDEPFSFPIQLGNLRGFHEVFLVDSVEQIL